LCPCRVLLFLPPPTSLLPPASSPPPNCPSSDEFSYAAHRLGSKSIVDLPCCLCRGPWGLRGSRSPSRQTPKRLARRRLPWGERDSRNTPTCDKMFSTPDTPPEFLPHSQIRACILQMTGCTQGNSLKQSYVVRVVSYLAVVCFVEVSLEACTYLCFRNHTHAR